MNIEGREVQGAWKLFLLLWLVTIGDFIFSLFLFASNRELVASKLPDNVTWIFLANILLGVVAFLALIFSTIRKMGLFLSGLPGMGFLIHNAILVMFLYSVIYVGAYSINGFEVFPLKFNSGGNSSIADLGKLENKNSKDCNEQSTLSKAKYCTLIVNRNDGGHGTGFAIEGGYIVTNHHVIVGAKTLSTYIDKITPLNVWGYDENADLAVLKSDIKLSTCDWANSNEIDLAETLFVMGWPGDLTEGESSITRGIYSRLIKTKEGPEFIQTDAAINPGNSGGPLLDKCGIVGINESKVVWSESLVPAEGLGFAIASNYAKPIIENLITSGKIQQPPPDKKKQIQYTPDYDSGSGSNQNQNTRENVDVNGWIRARDTTREMKNYWINKDPGGYDQGKLNELKDLLTRMSSVVESIVPKLMAGTRISSEENRLLGEWNSMYSKALNLESQLDGQNYSSGYYHKECRSGSCQSVSGRGKNGCSSYYDCAPKYHFKCVDMMCQYVQGDGSDECYLSSDCGHSECQGNKCVKVSGKGTDSCWGDFSCTHNECKDGKCVQVDGPGTSSCYSDYGCM